MIIYKSECEACPKADGGCVDLYCSYRKVKHYICDNCEEEVEAGELYRLDDQELCIECVKETLEKVF